MARAAEQSVWHAMRQACAADMEQKCNAIHGANCAGWWPSIARCTIGKVWGGAVSQSRVEACIANVEEQRQQSHMCNICGDPVASVIHCATGY